MANTKDIPKGQTKWVNILYTLKAKATGTPNVNTKKAHRRGTPNVNTKKAHQKKDERCIESIK